MARTQLTGQQVSDGSVQRSDLDSTTAGQAVIKKIIAGAGISITFTGTDSGTGDVTVTATPAIAVVPSIARTFMLMGA
jgi:hypothetical protein